MDRLHSPTRALSSPQASAQPGARLWMLLSYLLVTVAAFLPRVLALGTYISGDEANFWLHRADVFLQALQSGNFAATAITTHPGVTTMWLGIMGRALYRLLGDLGWLSDGSFATFLGIWRLPAALVHVAGVVLGYALLRRLLSPNTALLAALLWALDPFVVAFSRHLHTDALPATFLTLSLLAACLYWWQPAPRRWLVLSAVCAGLAILSKSPSLVIIPLTGFVALLGRWPSLRAARSWKSYGRFLGSLLAWGAICALTVFILWPALWVDPMAAYAQVFLGVEGEGGQPHMLGNFFLGQEDDAPGPLFYPVALALRLTPWTMIGLFLVPLAMLAAQRRQRSEVESTEPVARWWGIVAVLALFAIVFLLAMTVFPKKFNRYLVPIFPALDILAAIGLIGATYWIGESVRRWLKPALLLAVTLAAAVTMARWHPYGIVYFNPLLGGAQAGARTFTIGWGEGLNEVADWLNQQPNITGVRIAATMDSSLQPYLRSGAQAVTPDDGPLPPQTGYVVVYVRNVQWGTLWPPFDQFYQRRTPAHVVTIHGIDYAWIYEAPPEVDQQLPTHFGENLQLYGFWKADSVIPGQNLTMRLAWDTSAPQASDLMLFAHLIDASGQTVARVDLPLPASSWQPGRYALSELALPLPADLPAGDYRLMVGLYDPATGQRLPLAAGEAADESIDGPNARELTIITVPGQ